MSDLARVLEAGGLVPPGTALPDGFPVDTVDARGYRHPALPDRVVVRLVADVVAQGVDTEMNLLGFQLAEHHDDIALRRRQALGFPGRALLEDPERARYALDVMKEFKVHAKRIASKPGHARDGFDEIAERLARSVPHFLPSYWEEVGRAFAEAGNISYAAGSFDKARAAEREFGLKVDEEIRGDAFLEFALLGALTVKSLQSYGKELQQSVGANAAFERMFSLAVRRTLGGLAPWASMVKDLRSLAKAAKRDVAAEDRRLMAELLPSSSLVKAPRGFWQETRDAVVALASEQPAIRARLLELFPNGGQSRYAWRRDDGGFTDLWVDLLAASGALDVLWDAGAPAESVPNGGRAAWFGRFQRWATAGDPWILQLVRKAGPTLKAIGEPVVVEEGDYYSPLDLDLIELLLEDGIPWKLDEGYPRIQLDKWAQWSGAEARYGLPAEVRPRDPVRAAVHTDLVAHFAQAVDAAFGDDDFEQVAGRMTGLRALREAWLHARIGDVQRSGLALTDHALDRLESATRPSHFAEFPGALEALKAADPSVALQRTLRAGLIDELGWPAFDEAMRLLAPARDADMHVNAQWPHLILGDERKLLVLGPDGIELTHDIKLGKDIAPSNTVFVGGQLFVGASQWVRGTGYRVFAYWSNAPSDTFEMENLGRTQGSTPWLDGDALVFGGGRFTRGDRVAPPYSGVQFHDRERSWTVWDGKMYVQDRGTGKRGEEGAPGFLSGVPMGHLSDANYRVLPASIAETSPFGALDGIDGSKVRYPVAAADLDPDDLDDEDAPVGVTTLETLHGARFTGTMELGTGRTQPTRLMRFPGSDAWRPVAGERYRWRNHHDLSFSIGDVDTPHIAFAQSDDLRMAVGFVPPIPFWAYLQPRDPAGSAALRGASVTLARSLLDAAAADEEEDARKSSALSDAVARLAPQVSDPTVRMAVAVVAKLAADLEERLVTLRTGREGGVAGEHGLHEVADSAVSDALSNLRSYYSWGQGHVTAEIRALGAALVRGEAIEARWSRIEPRDWIGRIRALAWCVTRPGLTEAQRADLIEVLQVWRDSGLAAPGRYRTGRIRVETLPSWIPTEKDDGEVCPIEEFTVNTAGARMFVWDCDTGDEGPWDMSFIERSEGGEWPRHEGAILSRSREVTVEGDEGWLDAFLAAARERGARAVPVERVAQLSEAAGLSPVEASIALSVFPTELSKEDRALFNVKAVEAKAAASAYSGLGLHKKLDFLAAAAPSDPARLWDDGPDGVIREWIDAWLARFGRVVPVPAELLAAADKELGRGGASDLRKLAAWGSWEELQADGVWVVDADGDVARGEEGDEHPPVFDGDLAETLCHLLPWVATRLPVGDPLRDVLPGVLALARQRAACDGLWLDLGNWYIGDEKSKARKAGLAWFDALGGEYSEVHDDDGDVSVKVRRAGPIVASANSWRLQLVARPAGLDPSTRAIVETYARLSESDSSELAALQVLQSDDLRALAARITKTPVPAGGWEQDARISAPEALASVRTTLGLGEDAALLYLQTLTLLDPTKKNVIQWNGWAPKAYVAAAAELVDKGLLLEGKRARAGREHFLPGGWSEEKRILPYEEWKRPLYGWSEKGYPLGMPVPTAPIHVLFARAAARLAAGDAPRFQEVRR